MSEFNKNWKYPYKDPVWTDKKYLRDRKKLFKEHGNSWYVDLWNRIW